MTSVGLVGLGVLGTALGRRLRSVGMVVSAIETRESARQSWQSLTGAEAFGSVRQAGIQDRWFNVTRTAEQARTVMAEIVEMGSPEPIYVLTTLTIPESQRLVDSPGHPRVWPVAVSGGELGALRGQLVAAVPSAMPEADRHFLRTTVASRLIEVGGTAQVATVKALANAMIAYQFRALDRIIDVGVGLGIPARALVEMIQYGSAGSPALDALFEYEGEMAENGVDLASELGPITPTGVAAALESVRARTRARDVDVGSPEIYSSH